MIRKYNPTKVLVNFDYESKSIPGLSGQIFEIKKEFPDLHLKRILSPSGSAGNHMRNCLMIGNNILP